MIPKYCKNVKHHRIDYDPVSYFGKGDYGDHKQYKQIHFEGSRAQSLLNFY